MKALLTLLFVLFISNSNSQTLIRWDFERVDGTHTLFPTFISDTSIMDVNDVRYSSLYPLNGNPVPGVSGSPFDWANSVRGWYPDSSIHTYTDTWTEFRFFVDGGVAMVVDSVSLWYKRNSLGPRRFDFRSHKDLYGSAIDAILLSESDVSWHKWSIPLDSFTVNGFEQVTFRIYGDGAPSQTAGYFSIDSVAIFGSIVPSQSLHLRAFIAGPFVDSLDLLRDDLRTQGLVPLVDPYGSSKTVTSEVLAVSGDTAIVDWILVELRHPYNPQQVLRSIPSLLRRDGVIVSTNGVNPPVIDLDTGQYYLALKHRNHLAVMTATPVSLSDTIDFTLSSIPVFGAGLRKQIGSSWCLWEGDVNGDNSIRYIGEGNDRDLLLQDIGGVSPTNTTGGYLNTDVNMDGVTKYTGQNNDRDLILFNIGGIIPTNVRFGSVP
ncbi:MAG: large repetitive protein [Patescibacteria group bacterium]|nr:large repetitive protein [Patescibacteria group bacterium]